MDTKGQPPPFRLHSSAAVVANKWIIHGGRRNGKFNVTNEAFVFDFNTLRQATAASHHASHQKLSTAGEDTGPGRLSSPVQPRVRTSLATLKLLVALCPWTSCGQLLMSRLTWACS